MIEYYSMPSILISLIVSLLVLLVKTSVIFASSPFIKLSDPVLSPVSNTWENQSVHAPNVMIDGNVFKMWYGGNDGNKWQIGYATSSSGIVWTKNIQNPIIPSAGVDEYNAHTPRVIKDDSLYKMWYTTYNQSTQNFRIRYATSTDGISWNKQGVVLSPSQLWDINAVAYPFVVKRSNNDYIMFYTGNGLFQGSSRWRIGSALSSDGVNWVKNINNPTLYATQGWEGGETDGTSILFDGTVYEIFYHGGDDISYAYTANLIDWSKPQDKNPVITRSGFDSNGMAGTSIVKQATGTRILYYGGLSGSTWRIGLAADGPIATPSATPSPSPTPTSTPTPSPTPTSTPTPTPTPTPVPTSKKVVIVPGLGASWNKDAILNCKVSNYKGNWKLAFYAEKYYKPLYTVLSDEGYTISPYYYDWRKNVPTHANSLNTFIANTTEDGEKINLLGHSMGGLLGRSYLELVKEQNELSKFLSIGSPHRGVSSSYPAWSGGEIWEKDLLRRIAMTLAIKECEPYNTLRKTIQKNFPSTQNLLRIDDYLRNNATGQLKSVTSMNAQNNWLPTPNFTPPFYGVTVGSLTGVDQQTLDVIRVKKRSSIDVALGNWTDGKPLSREYSFNGDGTVLAQSSDIPGSIIKHIPQGHTDLIHSNDGYEAILQFLDPNVTFKQVSSSMLQKPTSAIIIIADPATVELSSFKSVIQSSDEGTLAIYNPTTGNYNVKITPKSSTTHVIVAQFLEDERVLWKEYDLTGTTTIQKTLLFNPLNPQEDALR